MRWSAGLRYGLILILGLVVVACESEPPPPTLPATPVVISRPLATVGPTQPPSVADTALTQQAIAALPTIAPPTAIASPTAYIGVFLGEVERDVLNPPLAEDPGLLELPPTRAIAQSDPLQCGISTAIAFGTNWTSEPRALNGLRCPIQESFGFVGEAQVFQRGAMYHNTATGEVWAILPSTQLEVGQYWYFDQTFGEIPNTLVAPDGFLLPEGVFGSVWVSTPEINATFGFARTPIQEIGVNLQRFEGGTLFLDTTVAQVFALLVNGDAFGPYQTVIPEQ